MHVSTRVVSLFYFTRRSIVWVCACVHTTSNKYTTHTFSWCVPKSWTRKKKNSSHHIQHTNTHLLVVHVTQIMDLQKKHPNRGHITYHKYTTHTLSWRMYPNHGPQQQKHPNREHITYNKHSTHTPHKIEQRHQSCGHMHKTQIMDPCIHRSSHLYLNRGHHIQ